MKYNYTDENELNAFRDNESRIKTDDRELDELDNEFSPDQLDVDMKRFNDIDYETD